MSLTSGKVKKTATAKDQMFHQRLVEEVAEVEKKLEERKPHAFVRRVAGPGPPLSQRATGIGYSPA